jgi:hypothetical protein
MTLRTTYFIGLLALSSLSASGQAMIGFSSSFSQRDGVYSGSANFQVSPDPEPLANAPYSGELVMEFSQTLADGTHITRPTVRQEKTWRDSQGRVRTERLMFGGRRDNDGPALIAEVSDPVAGYIYVLDNVNKVAHRVRITERPTPSQGPLPLSPPAGGGLSARTGAVSAAIIAGEGGGGGGGGFAVAGPGARAARANRPQPTVEDLGTKTIDGVLVSGTRQTMIIPEGEQGNDRPMTSTSETWRSKELHLTVLSTDYNPASGTNTTRIANLSTAEPDPALFMVPSDYSIVDEERSFTIKWGEQK